MGFIQFTTALALTAIFTIALISFGVNFAIDNDASVSLDDDFTTTQTDMETSTGTLYTGADVAFTAFQESTIQSQTESSEGGTSFKVTPATSLDQGKKAINVGWSKIFGSGSEFKWIFNSILAILGIALLMYGWKAWKGNPD